ncbi:aldehyde dehydrogenase family protein [Sphingorhabdus sp.]|uniref:aldehyde dehydrogenase family protein n=1 Tax=Sphingorhabdus sp. TaxID=1902408 RepID=UPI00261C422E|nr:aldehyde dehydrogenase family protein [Sphingorhabdus sp.]MDH4399560.1 aldehyde dehydrogenase family protein [Sphingorhabdus sp.]
MEVRYDMLVNGKLTRGSRTLDVVDPATAEVFAACACASREEIEDAVTASAAAFPTWSATSLDERRAVLIKMAEAIETNLESIARTLTSEQGKPIGDAQGEVGGAAYFLRYYAGLEIPVEMIEDSEARRIELHRRPLGVVAAIVPWNFPVLTAVNKVGAALITGNTVVVKPAATTPLATLQVAALWRDIVPAGVANIVTDKNDLGDVLTSHPLVRKVSFTGSTTTGMKVMASGSNTLKRMTLELGGNDSGIVLDDCDPDIVSQQLFDSAFTNNGQVCIALKRLYVHDSQYDAICSKLAEIANATIVGPGSQQGTQLGPVQNRVQFDKLKTLIEETRTAGTIIAGGDSPEGPGYFINPTIVRDIPDNARLVTDEQFGPVLPVMRFSDLDDVVARANDSSFGLGNSVWSSDSERAGAVAAQLDSGTVWINKHGDIGPDTPFAGAKMSGVGIEMGMHGLLEFTQAKVINFSKPVSA